jgi:hypothetical protein
MRLDTLAPAIRDTKEQRDETADKKDGPKWPKIRKGWDMKRGDYERGRALDQRVRAKLLGF